MVRSRTVGTHPALREMLGELIAERIGTDCGARRPLVGRDGPSHDVCPETCCLPPARPPAPGGREQVRSLSEPARQFPAARSLNKLAGVHNGADSDFGDRGMGPERSSGAAGRRRWSEKERGLMASRRLLLVEDSSTMRRMLSTMLADAGYEVETANDGLQGLAKARMEPRPELILTDYEMPELDGAGLCQALKADKELRSIPVLMLTTLGETRDKIAGLEAGADDYIEKPKRPGRLPGAVCADRGSPADRRPATRELTERNRLLEAAQEEVELRARAGPEGPVRADAAPAQAARRAAAGGPVHAGQPAGRRRLRFLPPREQPAGHPGGRRLGPRREFGDALGDGQGAGGAAFDRGARAGRAAGRAGRGQRAVFSRRLFLHGVLPDRRRGDRAGPLRGGRPPAGDHRRAERAADAAVEPRDAGHRHGRRHGRATPTGSSRASRW